eukprot:765094-Hanusia_phi.AAC.5
MRRRQSSSWPTRREIEQYLLAAPRHLVHDLQHPERVLVLLSAHSQEGDHALLGAQQPPEQVCQVPVRESRHGVQRAHVDPGSLLGLDVRLLSGSLALRLRGRVRWMAGVALPYSRVLGCGYQLSLVRRVRNAAEITSILFQRLHGVSLTERFARSAMRGRCALSPSLPLPALVD